MRRYKVNCPFGFFNTGKCAEYVKTVCIGSIGSTNPHGVHVILFYRLLSFNSSIFQSSKEWELFLFSVISSKAFDRSKQIYNASFQMLNDCFLPLFMQLKMCFFKASRLSLLACQCSISTTCCFTTFLCTIYDYENRNPVYKT